MKGPVLPRDEYGAVDYDSIPDVIQWFLDYDQRVAVIKHPKVEELFQWKQEQSRLSAEDVFNFSRAEDLTAAVAATPDAINAKPVFACLDRSIIECARSGFKGDRRCFISL